MRKIVIAFVVLLMPSLALAGGHSGLGGNGTGVVVDLKTMEGKSGVLVHQTTSDVWIYDNPPEGFPKATSATCSQFIAFAMGGYEDVLSDLQIWEVLAFIRSTWPKEIQDLHATRH